MVKDEQYLSLLEEIDAAVIEADFTARLLKAQYWHAAGGAIRQYADIHNVGPTDLVREVCKDLKKSEKTVWDAYRLNKMYPKWDDLVSAMGGNKALSWTAARRVLLGSGEKTDPEIDLAKVARGIVKRYGPENARVIAEAVVAGCQTAQNAPDEA